MTSRPVCPECATPVEIDWEWCHGCGFDPDGKLAAARTTGPAPLAGVGAPTSAPDLLSAPAPGDLAGPSSPAPPPASPTVSPPSAADSYNAPAPAPSEASSAPDPSGWSDDPLEWSDEPVDLSDEPIEPASWPAGSNGVAIADGPVFVAGGFPGAGPPQPLLEPAPTGSAEAESIGGWSSGAADFDQPAPPPPPPSSPFHAAPSPGPTMGSADSTSWAHSAPPGNDGGAGSGRSDLTGGSSGSGPKLPLLIAGGVVLVIVLGFIVVRMSSNDRPVVDASTRPPALGQITLNTSPTTVATPVTAFAGWVQYRAPDGSWVAGFPVNPTARAGQVDLGIRSVPGVEVDATTGPDGARYGVFYMELPSELAVADSRAGYDLFAERNLKDAGTDVFVGNGLEGVLYTGTNRAGTTVSGMIVVKGGRLYELSTVGAELADVDHFVRSFQVLR